MTRIAASLLILMLVSGAAINGFYAPEPDLAKVFSGPEWRHPFGFDSLGRDVFLRSLQALFSSFVLSFCASLISATLGFCLGGVAGLRGGRLDLVLMRAIDILEALPDLLLSAVFLLIWRVLADDDSVLMQFIGLALAMGLTGWLGLARQMRALALRERSTPYVEAAVALGASRARIIFAHIWPNIKNSLLLLLLLQVPGFVLFEATLSFFGLGLSAPQTSLGQIMLEGWKLLSISSHLILGPTLLLFLSLIAFQLLMWPTRRKGLANLRRPLPGFLRLIKSHDPVPKH